MEYNFNEIEGKWRQFWAENKTFKVEKNDRPKFYVLDMFPYPSGAGLHVGHPLGYIASDIYARYKRLRGFNVLHPMGYDSFGLPAEQYAIQTGQHPAITTEDNVARYREQMDQIGFSFDWDREVRTSSPEYYKWTQWIFVQLFNSFYNISTDKAESISSLIDVFASEGNANVKAVTDYCSVFTAEEWNSYDALKQEEILQEYRLAYLADSWVNWCPALGTVLANDEVINGLSERGGHPVEQKLMRQWSMRIKAYAERLLTGLDGLEWTDSIKDIQRNWIGKSQGASVAFKVDGHDAEVEVFTTRPDTIFGVSFMVLAPEHPLVDTITTAEYAEQVAEYKRLAGLKSERDRQADVKNITGQFTGAYAIHPFNGEQVQIWIGDYVLASYGTGAVMAVPCGDQRDYDFAKHFNLEIKNIFQDKDISEAAYVEKDAVLTNSDFLNGLTYKDSTEKIIAAIEEKKIGKGKTNYRLRDAVFSRQRYWGEPFPIYYKNGIPTPIDVEDMPIILPEVEKYLPTEDGQPPLGNAKEWAWDTVNKKVVANTEINDTTIFPLELNTMPGWAGSSWYFLRYADPKNAESFAGEDAIKYWGNVDLYMGGSEHATGHLLYARFWTKFLNDRGHIPFDEPFQKMINQGMILGTSALVRGFWVDFGFKYERSAGGKEKVAQVVPEPIFVAISNDIFDRYTEDDIKKLAIKANASYFEGRENHPSLFLRKAAHHVDIKYVDNNKLDVEGASNDLIFSYLSGAEILRNDQDNFICDSEVEKMSKSKFNVQTPDELVLKFGADTLRCYEMFLGPIEQAKPWDTKGINGVANFLRKVWRLFYNQEGQMIVQEVEPTKENLKTLHKTIKKVVDDLERYSFNTGVSNFMICVNELTEQKCVSKTILEQFVIMLSPYAPHIAEELYAALGNKPGTVSHAQFPIFDENYLVEANHAYPVSINGKMRFKAELPTAMSPKEVEETVLGMPEAIKWTEGKTPKKVIVVPSKIVNIVV